MDSSGPARKAGPRGSSATSNTARSAEAGGPKGASDMERESGIRTGGRGAARTAECTNWVRVASDRRPPGGHPSRSRHTRYKEPTVDLGFSTMPLHPRERDLREGHVGSHWEAVEQETVKDAGPWRAARPDSPSGVEASRSEIEMQAKSVVDPVHDVWRHSPDASVETFDGDSADLFRLGLRVTHQTAGPSRQADLEWVDPAHIAGNRHDGHHTSSRIRCALVRAVIARDYRRSPVRRLGPGGEAEIHHPDVAPPYRRLRAQSFSPSLDDRSHAELSSSCHSAQAAA